MSRRDTVFALAALTAAAGPLRVFSQPPKIRRIGVLLGGTAEGHKAGMGAFAKRLREYGICSNTIRVFGTTKKGYLKDQFVDAKWLREVVITTLFKPGPHRCRLIPRSKKNDRNIMTLKKVNAYAPPNADDSAKMGKVQEITAAMIQCVKLPKV